MLDYSALLGLTAGIQIAKADYDFARDGGAVGVIALPGDTIPIGAIAFHTIIQVTDAIVQSGSPDNPVGTWETAPLANLSAADYWVNEDASPNNMAPQTATRPLVIIVTTQPITAGKFTVWVFYLPT